MRDCQFDVSPVNYSDSDSDPVTAYKNMMRKVSAGQSDPDFAFILIVKRKIGSSDLHTIYD